MSEMKWTILKKKKDHQNCPSTTLAYINHNMCLRVTKRKDEKTA